MIPHIRIEEYDYPLPDERIAKYPLERRDASKLLEFKDGKISEYHFYDIPSLLPDNALMVFNDTKVVPARLNFQREGRPCQAAFLPSDRSPYRDILS